MKINKTIFILLVVSIVLSIILSSAALVKVNNLYNETTELANETLKLADHLLYYTEAFNDLLDILAGPNEQDTADFNFNEL